MARLARVVASEVPHHITQRGNARRVVFESASDRIVYLTLLRQSCIQDELSLLGYCLMSNHVHLIAVPRRPEAMAIALRHTHGRYAAYLNARYGASGHVWQGRYYSCPLDRNHLWMALRYTECNPVRAGMISKPQEYEWSSARAHCGGANRFGMLDSGLWQTAWNATE
jgi:putative transposase